MRITLKNHRENLAYFLNTHHVHSAIIALIVFDLLVILTEMFLTIEYCGDEHVPHEVEEAEKVLGYISFVIIVIMAVEITMAIYANGLKYFSKKIHVFDAVVVYVALLFEILAKAPFVREIAGLLLILRTWRIVRVMHATSEISMEELREKYHRSKDKIQELEAKLAEASVSIPISSTVPE